MGWVVVFVMAIVGIAMVAIAATGSQSKVWAAITGAVSSSSGGSSSSSPSSSAGPAPSGANQPGYRPSPSRLGSYG